MSDTSEYLYVLRPTRTEMLTEGPTPEEAEVLGRHASYLQELAGDGRALLFGRTQTTDENTIGIVILRADSEAMARGMMEDDPVVSANVMGADLFPYRIAGGSLVGDRS